MGLYLLLYGRPLRNNSFSNDNESVPVIGLDYISNTVGVGEIILDELIILDSNLLTRVYTHFSYLFISACRYEQPRT
jgi:hypothetical protein